MASIESRNGSRRIVFWHDGIKHHFTLGEVSDADAVASKSSTEELLRLLKRKLIAIPSGCGIEDFMFHRGNPPEYVAPATNGQIDLTLTALKDAYFRSQQKKLEQTTLDGITLHFNHLTRILGTGRMIPALTRPDLQSYVDKRSEEWIDPNVYRKVRRANPKQWKRNFKKPRPQKVEGPDMPRRHPSSATIRKEIVSLRTAWNWARRQLELAPEFPGSGLDFAKIEESLPFMTWEEAERRIAEGDDPGQIWDCVYLRPVEIAELLSWVKERPVSPWVYPILCFAGHTGARRSEIVRVRMSDVDLTNSVVTIREKKRDKSRTTTRRVPLTPFLKKVLSTWIEQRGRGKTLFCKADGNAITPREAMNYFDRALRTSKWSVLRGLHVFRHSYISALASKGIDQRVIDDLAGHSTEQQRRRYRHLYPDVKHKAVTDVFA